MEIEGMYTLQASPEDVWRCLTDKRVLLNTVPGMERLERVEKQMYSLAMRMKFAPLIGTYYGHVIIPEYEYPSYYRVLVENVEGQQHTMSGEGVVFLHKHGDTTTITYKGSLSFGKIDALLPASLVRGATKLLVQQFFNSLAEQLRTTDSRREDTYDDLSIEEEVVQASTVRRSSTRIVRDTPSPSLLRSIVHLLHIGSGNPIQEERWTTRIRRISTISALLFLVWVGTRLPRR